MRIATTIEEPEMIRFNDVKVGEYFTLDPDKGGAFIRIETVFDESDMKSYNAVNLKDGKVIEFMPDSWVATCGEYLLYL